VSFVNLSPFAAVAVDADVATNDGVAMTVRGKLQGQVVDPVAAALKVVDYEDATRKILQTAMRALVMQRSSAELNEGQQHHPDVADEVSEAVRSWGIAVLSLSFDVAAASSQ
jgi:regulator of protease activity HflC (stomatin/prohibitin superfamily)